MIDTIESAYSDLTCIDAADELCNSTIISFVEESMPKSMFSEWVKLAVSNADCSTTSKFQKLLAFLQEWRRMIEYQDANIRSTPSTWSTPIVEASVCHSSTSGRKCLIHKNDEHPVWRCRIFRAMSPGKRHDIVSSSNACTLCLDIGHSLSDCPKTFKCTVPGCNASHNFLLHDPFSASH